MNISDKDKKYYLTIEEVHNYIRDNLRIELYNDTYCNDPILVAQVRLGKDIICKSFEYK